ncbi:crossover junction endodeoxyribonuclease RuvC [Halomonas sp. ISL-60]|uniref:crossover junction endodeoxyribonuclease RuvC n=1 Tax=Halomonas sp. ISL-56 TaxID=2819149 RepID=UPI001BE694BD|nr:crossover junction endodeoxyribonuclease RuvC [Halomonas sp. ISL-56]MBT2771341.1 crossover junction endodeoxyribonuclease RuvC [Halomonas sp. ISL-60]MBT2800698.1 crossover junction endodeoxyribonuclease RuvC [Halomonas sp. ISL-56]
MNKKINKVSRKCGIDQSLTKTGIVIFDNDSQTMIHHEIIETKLDRTDALDSFKRVAEIASRIEFLCDLYKVTSVRIEGLSYASVGQATRTLAGLHYVIVDRLMRASIDVAVIAPTALKKAATGSGRADKQAMLDAVREDDREQLSKYGKTKGRFDLADAWHLASLLF